MPVEKKTKTAAQALSSLMRLCSRAEKSSGDALRLMHRWEVPEGDRQGVLEKLTASKFIDDSRFAECYVRDRMSFSGWGPYKIRQGLAAKGIARDIIDRAMAGQGGMGGGRLAELLEKKKRKTGYKDLYDLRTKLVRYGAGLGYPYSEVFEEVERLVGEE